MKSPIGFSRVKFTNPFKLKGVEGEQMAGTYGVEVRDERTGWLKFLKAPIQSTWITIRHFHGLKGALEDFLIVPKDLTSALRRDKRSHKSQKDIHGSVENSGADKPSIRSRPHKARDK